MNENIRKCYKQQKCGNTSPLVQILNAICYTVIAYFIIRILLSELGFVSYVAAIMSVAFTGVFLVLRNITAGLLLDRYIARTRTEQKRKATCERLTLMPYAEFKELALNNLANKGADNTIIFPLQRIHTLDTDTILCMYKAAKAKNKTNIVICSTSSADKTALEFIERIHDINITVIPPEQIICWLSDTMPISDSEADSLFMSEIAEAKATRKNFWHKFTQQKKAVPYFICGGVLFALSFFLHYSLYYKLIAILCIQIGIFCFIRQKLSCNRK